MNIVQKPASAFAPFGITKEKILVTEVAGTYTAGSNVGVNFRRFNDVVGHFNVLLYGLNLSTATVTGRDADLVDSSEFPLLKRFSPLTEGAVIALVNDKATTEPFSIDFRKYSADPVYGPPITFDPGSYAEYSWNRVTSLVESSPNNKWLTGANLNSLNTRTNLSTFPHLALSGICVIGLWPNGFRPFAITKRHAASAGHYGEDDASYIGKKLYWRDHENGTIIERTITAVQNFLSHMDFGIDLILFTWAEDLPANITPLPVAGHWLENAQIDYSLHIYNFSLAAFGITVWGRDGEWQPSLRINFTWANNGFWFLPAGRGFGRYTYESPYSAVVMSPGFQFGSTNSSTWDRLFSLPAYGFDSPAGSKFHHSRIGGDSGSVTCVPVIGGWAVAGGETSEIPSKEGFDIMIGILDTKSGISTGYTVTVAPSPLT